MLKAERLALRCGGILICTSSAVRSKEHHKQVSECMSEQARVWVLAAKCERAREQEKICCAVKLARMFTGDLH